MDLGGVQGGRHVSDKYWKHVYNTLGPKPMIDSQMQAIPIDEFFMQSNVFVDCYVRLSSGKYILIAKSGQSSPADALQKYKDKGVQVLFVSLEDYQKFVLMALSAADEIINNERISQDGRMAVLETAATAVYREIQNLGFSDEIFSHARLINHATMMFVERNRDIKELIEALGKVSESIVRHSMMVSLMSTMIGHAHNWVKPATLEKLALGGFLHDIGKSKLPKEILTKHPSRFNHDEKIIYQSHTETGKQLLLQSKIVPDDVLLIVSEHHEYSDGSGFPLGLKDYQISPLARVVTLANAFVRKMELLDDKNTASLEAYKELQSLSANRFNKDALKALSLLLNPEEVKATG